MLGREHHLRDREQQCAELLTKRAELIGVCKKGITFFNSLALRMGASNSDEGLPPFLSCCPTQKQRCLDFKWAEGLENHWA